MKAETLTLTEIFGKDVRYIVPLYQRPYVWEEEKHWEPLWDDILWVLGHANNGNKPTPHFLGALVLEQEHTQLGEIERRLLIDGQQRLTTLQLLLRAAAEVAAERGFDNEVKLLSSLTENPPERAATLEERLKIWPTNTNRNAFVAVMAPEDATSLDDDPTNRVQEAHIYFKGAIREWLLQFEAEYAAAQNYHLLTAVVRELLKLVVINLEPEDNAQAIFETLNARGTPLLAVDLAKNLVFQLARTQGIDADALYHDHWRHFDRDFWRKDVRQGRLMRPRSELFLMHWLTMTTAEEQHANQLFTRFKRLVTADGAAPVVEITESFAASGACYEDFERGPQEPVPNRFFSRLKTLDTGTSLPIALWLYAANLDHVTRDAVLLIMESWYVRRMLCRLTAQGYNRLTVDHLKELRSAAIAPDELTYERLRQPEADSSRWPSDEEVFRVLTEEPVYNRLTQARIVNLLWELEKDMRTDFAEVLPVPAKLTIEHVLPQKWRDHWPAWGPDAELTRDLHVHRLGNLTLATSKLNPSMSNAPWPKKRDALNAHSILLMNRRIVDTDGEWNEEKIDERSRALAERALRLWPSPETTIEEWRVLAASGGPGS